MLTSFFLLNDKIYYTGEKNKKYLTTIRKKIQGILDLQKKKKTLNQELRERNGFENHS